MSAYTIKPENGSIVSDPIQLKLKAAEAVKSKEYKRACHMYTLALDILLSDVKEDGTTEWAEVDTKSDGLLHILLSNRSFTYYKLGDFNSAVADAEHCCAGKYWYVLNNEKRENLKIFFVQFHILYKYCIYIHTYIFNYCISISFSLQL